MNAAQLFAIVSVKGASGSVSALKGVSGQVDKTQSSLSKVSKGAGQLGVGLARIGVAAAGAVVTGLGAAAKTSMDFQDAFAGVRKTVEGSPAELDGLYKQLENLSTRIPVSFQDIAGVAQEAGALGVPTQRVSDFAEAVSRTTAATVGLDTATASEAFGKLGTIFNLNKTADGYDRLGSTLIELGNTQASTEPDILEITRRFAAAGQAAGLSAAQTLGWASAIGSLGQQPEAAGSSLQRFFQISFQNAAAGGTKFKLMAKIAGESASSFKKSMGKDASGALESFLKGLNKLDKFQQQDVLKKMGLSNVRTSQGILLLAQHTDLLDSSLATAGDAWQQNAALMDVSNKRFDTMKNKLVDLKNTGFVALADLGDGLTPALGRLAEKARTFLQTHEGDFTAMGRDIGKAIDEIDWTKVEDGASMLFGWAQKAYDIFRLIPPQIDLAVAGFLGLNKVSGGLLGAGLSNIAGGIAGGLGGILGRLVGNLGSHIPGIGGVIGSLTATRVYVVNWPGGLGKLVGGPASPLNPAEDAAGGLGKLGILKFALRSLGLGAGLGLLAVNNAAGPNGGLNGSGFFGNIAGGALAGASVAGPFGALAGGLIGITKGVQEQVSSHNAAMATGISDTIQQLIASHATPDQLQAALDATNQGIDHLNNFAGPLSGIANAVVGGGALDQLKADRDALLKAVAATRPAAEGEHSAAGARQVAAINAMSNLTSKNLVAFRNGEHQDITGLRTGPSFASATAERKGNEMNAGIARVQSGVLTVADVQREARARAALSAASQQTVLERIAAKKDSFSFTLAATVNTVIDGRQVAHDVVRWTKGGVGLA